MGESEEVSEALTVFFEDPFWVLVFERTEGNSLSVCKVTAGTEPRDYEIYDFVLRQYSHLRFSPAVEASAKQSRPNPKRLSRLIHKELEQRGIGTRSQQALKLQQEMQKAERRVISKEQREAEKEYRFAKKMQKKKEKQRGR